MDILWQDLRFGFRMLWKSRSVTIVAVLALALGIGANTAIFSVINGVLLRPFPYKDSDRLVVLWERSQQMSAVSVSIPDYFDWKEQNRCFEDISGQIRRGFILTGSNEPEQLSGSIVPSNVFSILGLNPILGRTFSAEEDKVNAEPVVVISQGLWQRRFGSDSNILGKTLTLNEKNFTVIGVMPSDFQYPTGSELWVPLGIYLDELPKSRGAHPNFYAIARLKPGITVEQARADMDIVANRLAEQYPDSNRGGGVTITPLLDANVGYIRTGLLTMFAAVAFVLLIACANVANLMLARASARQKEIAIRIALGAGRWRLIRQLLTESILLSLCSGILGLLIALWGIDLLLTAEPGSIPVPRLQNIGIDVRVLGFTMVTSILTGLFFGLVPALQSTKPKLNENLKESGRGVTEGFGRKRIRNLLVIAEVGLSLVLLIGAGLLIKSFLLLRGVNPGFNSENALTMNISIPKQKYTDLNSWTTFYKQLLEKIRSIPGVEHVCIASGLPLAGGGSESSVFAEGQAKPEPGNATVGQFINVNDDYFRTMGIPLLKGRFFTEQDVEGAKPVAIIDETMAQKFWPNEDPIGKRFAFETRALPNSQGQGTGQKEFDPLWREVIGVVGHTKHYGLDAPSRVQMYVPYLQLSIYNRRTWPTMSIVVRTGSDPSNIISAVREQVASVDKNVPVTNIATFEQIYSRSISNRRFNMLLLGILAVIALVLASLGIYGVISYTVTQRTHEIGVRMALGAQQRDVLKLILGHGLKLTFLGLAIGLVAAFALTRLISSLLFGVSATDPLIFASISLLLAAVALIASYLPARRATKVDPMIALRYE
jgi:putative ABC transport system permease protein